MTRPRLPDRILCLVTDGRPGGWRQRLDALAEPVEAALRGGVNMVQVREKHLPPGDLLRVATELRRIASGRALLVVNDSVDVAVAADADGVQLGELALPTAAARATGGDAVLIGRSVHSTRAALKAEADGADFLVLGTVFPSRSHPGGPVGGLELVRDVTAAVRLPVIGIGGITAEAAGRVIEAGASGVAVISAILGDADPEGAARRLWEAVRETGQPGGQRCE